MTVFFPLVRFCCRPWAGIAAVASVGFALTSCAKAPPAAAAPNDQAEIDLTQPRSAPPAWPPGLTPCAKDDPTGASCGVTHTPAGDGGVVAATAPVANDTTVWAVPVGPDDPARGPADALVTLVVFSDFECPFCKRATPLFERVLGESPKDVRLIWKDLPLPMHEHAEAAAELARAARAQLGDAGFWAAHDLLYGAQTSLGDGAFRRICDKLGLPWTATMASVRGARFGKIIQSDTAESDAVDVPATPTTFVNGRKLVGAQPYERLHALVAEELVKATRLVESGVPRSGVYAKIIESGVHLKPSSDIGTSVPR